MALPDAGCFGAQFPGSKGVFHRTSLIRTVNTGLTDQLFQVPNVQSVDMFTEEPEHLGLRFQLFKVSSSVPDPQTAVHRDVSPRRVTATCHVWRTNSPTPCSPPERDATLQRLHSQASQRLAHIGRKGPSTHEAEPSCIDLRGFFARKTTGFLNFLCDSFR